MKILSCTNARSTVLLGQSMGGFVTLEMLRDIGIGKQRNLFERLEAVILDSPGIDGKVFQTQIEEVRPLPHLFVIFVSSRDRALLMWQRLRGVNSGLARAPITMNCNTKASQQMR
ncbi:MAG: alpha/beta hydrolase [Rhizobiaceae bacterium]